MDSRNFHDIIIALLTLLPKLLEADTLKDYMPILSIHLLGKLFSKVLVNRLVPHLGSLIDLAQSAFIKGRFIQANFKVVQSMTKLLHAQRYSRLLLKVDIMHTFDSVACSFLIKVMHHVGFPIGWLNWVSVLLSTVSTCVLLNGSPGSRIFYTRGMHQGPPSHRCCPF
jgi:hypothetical protein